MDYSMQLTYNGKNVFTIELDGQSFTKRFSGNWNGQQHFNYIKEDSKSKEEAIDYLEGRRFLSSLYPVEIDDYNPFIKNSSKLYCFELKEGLLIIQSGFEIDTEDEDNFSFDFDEYIYDYINEEGIRRVSEPAGNADGCFFFNETIYYPIVEENEIYFKTVNGLLYFKGVDSKNQKFLFKKSQSFLEDFALTDSFKNKILSLWN